MAIESGVITNFPNGVSSFGVPVFGSGYVPTTVFGKYWYVNAGAGGLSPSGAGTRESPFTTMDQAFDQVSSGDVIIFKGKVREQLTTPVGIFNVTVYGAGTRPRHADAHTGTNGASAATWMAPASGGTAAQATVRVLQQGWVFQNILFAAIDSDAAMVELVRNAGADDAERDASHAMMLGCRFSGAGKGIRFGATSFTENVFNALVDGCKFNACTYGIYNTTGSQPNSITVQNSIFQGCTNAITAQFQASTIKGNVIQGFTAASSSGGIDVRNGGGNNQITLNTLGGTYSNAGGYNGESGDNWYGNFGSGGVTSSDPA